MYVFVSILLIINVNDKIVSDVRYTHYFYQLQPGKFYYLYDILYGCCFGYSTYLIWKRISFPVIPERIPILYWLLGITSVGIIAELMNALSMYNVGMYNISPILLCVFSMLITYVMLKYKLIDIKVSINEQHVTLLIGGIIAGIFTILINIFCYNSWTYTVCGVCLAGFIFYPLTTAIGKYVIRDNVYISRQYAISGIDERIVSTFDKALLLNSTVERIKEIIEPKHIIIILINEEQNKYRPDIAIGFSNAEKRQIRLANDTGIIPWIRKNKEVILKQRLRWEAKFEYVWDTIEAEFDLLKATAVLPFIGRQDDVIGILCVDIEDEVADDTRDRLRYLTTLCNEAAIKLENTLQYGNRIKYAMNIIEALTLSIETKDVYTKAHSNKVARLCEIIADRLGLTNLEIEDIKIAGILHDIGKLNLPEGILQKQDKLTDKEFDIIKEHTAIGKELLQHVNLHEEIVSGIYLHHERIDGKGYPEGYTGDKIPLIAKIIAVADSYDAMVSERPYRSKPMSNEEAMLELERNTATKYDPEIANIFIEWLTETTKVQLSES
jgi:putative nucleotidyltransferase with HDIG domain